MADRDALLNRIHELELRLALAEQNGGAAMAAGSGSQFAERVASALTSIPLTSISERGGGAGGGASAVDAPLIAKGEAATIDIAAASAKNVSADAAAYSFASTALVLAAYCVSGTLLTLANKIAISAFPHPNMLLFIQNGVTLLLLWSGMRVWPSTFRTCASVQLAPVVVPRFSCRLISCIDLAPRLLSHAHAHAPGATPPINMDAFRRWLPLVSLFVCMLVSSLFALKFVSAVTVLHRVQPRSTRLRASI